MRDPESMIVKSASGEQNLQLFPVRHVRGRCQEKEYHQHFGIAKVELEHSRNEQHYHSEKADGMN